MQFLSLSLIIDLHKGLINKFGGLGGIRDKALLESAVACPRLFYSICLERDEYVLAAAYFYHLIKNHPFIDGNKRIGVLAMLNKLYNLAIQVVT